MSRTIRIIIDTDPGQDDAMAILLALAATELEVAAITTVAGNVPVALTTMNALRMTELARRRDVPVHRGAERPLLRKLRTAEFVGGPDGLEGALLPVPAGAPHAAHAVPAIVDLLRAAPEQGITLCTLGPLTNVALALAQDRALARKLARIVMMGGARDLGNITPAAEFNFYVDPHAAQIVLECGAPIVLFGLHATHQAMGTPERMAPLARLDTAVARAVHGMFERPRPGGLKRFGVAGHPVHDPCVIAWLLWPELFQGRDCHVAVETGGETTIGRSVIDWWGTGARPNVHVIERIDPDPLFARMIERLATFK